MDSNDFLNRKREYENEINQLKENNKELKNTINEYVKIMEDDSNQINQLKKEINELKENKKELKNTINEYVKIMEDDSNQINQLKKEINELKDENILQKEELAKLNNNENNSIILRNNILNQNESFIDFYDVIIDIKSIKDIKKGWEIKMNERGKKKYYEYKGMKIIRIGVIGNSNKGKSFLLSKISKIKLPTGTSIRTEGLSIKYPELEGYTDRKIVLLDSAGLETPVLKDNEYEIIKNENDNSNDYSIIDNGNQSQNLKKDLKEYFKEKSREKLITELFLQNYIIHNSEILILVVGIFTYSEQKLLNRIKTEIERAKIDKPLYIIHNLITYTSISQVNEYINEFLLKSVTFDLEEGHNISTRSINQNGIYFYEKKSNPKIFHLIFANEESEAGKYYNQFTLNFLENSYQNVTDLKTFDVIKTVKERFLEISKDIIDEPKNIEFKFDDNENEKCIKLNSKDNIILKKCLIDELGFSNLKGDGFEPKYSYYKKDKNTLIIFLECPGICDLRPEVYYEGVYNIIKLSGIKYKDKEPLKFEDNIFNTREFGKFSLEIPLKTEEFLISDIEPIDKSDGIFIITVKIKEKMIFQPFIKPDVQNKNENPNK